MTLAFLKSFASRQPGPNRAYVMKDRRGDRLSMTDSQSRLLGVDEGLMCATFVISTDDPDRVDDVVTTKGIYLDNFKANPIAFYGHQAIILPVGKWAERDTDKCTIKVREHEAQGTCYFSQRTRDAEQVFALVAEGILRATSIGFNPMEEPTPRDSRKSNPLTMQRGYVFPKVDLLEVSIVGIPAQPTATLVREVLSKNKLGNWPIVPALRKSLQLLSEPDPVWCNGADLERDMSKKWGKAAPKKGKADCPPCECHDKDGMNGSDGTAGGYAVPEDEDGKKGKKTMRQKQPPPPPKKPGQDQAPRDQPAADPQEQQQPAPYPEQPEPTGSDPKEVLGRLVDALTDYLEITKPAAPPEMAEEEEEEEEPEDDMPDQQQNDESVGDERYEFRSVKPAKAKGKYHSVAKIKGCVKCMKEAAGHLKDLHELPDDSEFTKTHRTASLHHHKELMGMCKDMDSPDAGTDEDGSGESAEGGGDVPAEPVQKRKTKQQTVEVLKVPTAEDLELDLNADMILRELLPITTRVTAVQNAWNSLNGAKP